MLKPTMTQSTVASPRHEFSDDMQKLKLAVLTMFDEIEKKTLTLANKQDIKIDTLHDRLVKLESLLTNDNIIVALRLASRGERYISDVRFVWRLITLLWPLIVATIGILIDKGINPLSYIGL